jgi:hypothetical protein
MIGRSVARWMAETRELGVCSTGIGAPRKPAARGVSMLAVMAATSTPESTPQRLAAIRAQMSLLADYL